MSSLEREAQSKQQALTKTESQLAKYDPTLKQPTTKYKPTSKQEVLKRLRENVRQLTEEYSRLRVLLQSEQFVHGTLSCVMLLNF